MARVDYDRQSEVYDRGRTIPEQSMAVWMAVARRHLGDAIERILDLGAGTGRFSTALAETFEAEVAAVEPSAGMRSRAAGKQLGAVRYVGGMAESLPLADGSCDAAWLSNVIHHFDDVEAAAAELRRVVPEGGPVLLRGSFAGRNYDLPLYEFFPETVPIVEEMCPSIEETVGVFERAGFVSFHLERVRYVYFTSYADALEATRHRADSTLEQISDEAFEAGLERLGSATTERNGPVEAELDLLVLR